MKNTAWYLKYLKRIIRNIISTSNYRKGINFLHIPKTGGTYIGQLDSFGKPVVDNLYYLGHSLVEFNGIDYPYIPVGYSPTKVISEKNLKKEKTFSVVRNPFDWIVSYVGFSAGWNQKYFNPNHYDLELTEQGFVIAVKKILTRSGNVWPNNKFLFFQLFDSSGNLIPDMILKNESLDADVERMCSDLGLLYQKGDNQKVGKRKDYSSYYSDELKNMVEKVYYRELMLFGYSFQDNHNDSDLVNVWLDKSKLKYNFTNDEITYIDSTGTTIVLPPGAL
jgi:hypothetical protein